MPESPVAVLPECLSFLVVLEELFEDADNYRVDADAFGPLFELEPGLCVDVEELRIGKLHTHNEQYSLTRFLSHDP